MSGAWMASRLTEQNDTRVATQRSWRGELNRRCADLRIVPTLTCVRCAAGDCYSRYRHNSVPMSGCIAAPRRTVGGGRCPLVSIRYGRAGSFPRATRRRPAPSLRAAGRLSVLLRLTRWRWNHPVALDDQRAIGCQYLD